MIFTLRRTLLLAVIVFSQSFTLPLAAQRWETEWLPGDLVVQDFAVAEECIWVVNGEKLVQFNLHGEFLEEVTLPFEVEFVVVDKQSRPWVSSRNLGDKKIAYLNDDRLVELEGHRIISSDRMAFDSNNDLWISGLKDTLWKYSEGNWTSHPLPKIPDTIEPCNEVECTNHIESITIDEDDRIWGLSHKTSNLVYPQGWIYDPNDQTVIYDTFFGDLLLDGLWIDENNKAVYQTDNVLYFLDNEGKLTTEMFAVTPENTEILFIDNHNNYWIEAENKIYTFKPEEGKVLGFNDDWIYHSYLDTLFPSSIDKLEVDKNGTIWAKGDRILHRVTPTQLKEVFYDLPHCYQQEMGPFRYQFNGNELQLWKDGFGEVWYKNNLRIVHSACNKPPLDVPANRSPTYENFVMDHKGTMWLMLGVDHYTYYSSQFYKKKYWTYLKKYNGEEWIKVDSTDRQIYFGDEFLTLDENENIWFVYQKRPWIRSYGHDMHEFENLTSHIGMYDGHEWTFFEDLDSTVQFMTKDRLNRLWFSTAQKLLKFNGQHWEHIHYLHNMPELREIEADAEGNIWGYGIREDSLYKYDGNNWFVYPLPVKTDLYVPIGKIKADVTKGVWVLLNDDNGVYYTPDGQEWTHYTIEDGLINNYVQDIEVDGNGVVWFSSPGVGISRFYPESVTTNTYDHFDNTPNTWQAFPNPATNSITIKGLEEEATLEVFDIHGNLATSSKGKSVVVSQLKTGMYILSVTTAADKHTFKFLKE